MKVQGHYDVAVIGGGFSGVATVANIVRDTQHKLSIAVISRDPQGMFGPAYSTPRMEHLLNVHAKGMGLFADNHMHFYEWTQKNGITATPDDYLPRPVYGRYLKSVLDDTKALAREKGITLDWFQGEVEDIHDFDDHMVLLSGGDMIGAHSIVLAIGNSLKANTAENDGNVIGNPWHYDFSKLAGKKRAAIIGSGLTAADTIISILDSKWEGEMICYSGSALLPLSHLTAYDASARLAYDGGRFITTRLSHILQELRKEARKKERDWRYVVDSLRPLTQDIWRSLSETDKRRLTGRYFTLWNVHRHRYATPISRRIDDAIARGQLKMVKARISTVADAGNGATLELRGGRQESFDIAFQCTGVNYKIASNPLLKKLVDKGMLKPVSLEDGVRAYDNFTVYRRKPNMIYALGAPLFGTLFETTAVPELREEAKIIAETIVKSVSAARQSHALAASV